MDSLREMLASDASDSLTLSTPSTAWTCLGVKLGSFTAGFCRTAARPMAARPKEFVRKSLLPHEFLRVSFFPEARALRARCSAADAVAFSLSEGSSEEEAAAAASGDADTS